MEDNGTVLINSVQDEENSKLEDLAKLETMNFKFNDDYFNLNDLIGQAYDTMKHQAAQKDIRITTEYTEQLPANLKPQDILSFPVQGM